VTGDTAYARPLPTITTLTAPYWEGARQHELRVQRCDECASWWFPPAELCPECLSESFTWTPVSGRAKLWSWIDMWQLYFRGFADERPYTVAFVELEEGPRMMSGLVHYDRDSLRCDMPLVVAFDAVTPEITLPKFRPA
jgi:uncharacterized protein